MNIAVHIPFHRWEVTRGGKWAAQQYYVFCQGCKACGPLADTKEETERLWDERRES